VNGPDVSRRRWSYQGGVAQLLGTRALTFKAMKATQVQEVKR
jgi:hypothetical protein